MASIKLAPGDTAPAFTLSDQDGEAVSLSDFAGKKVIVYFYPAASTPGCTTEACDFRDNINSLKSSGYQVLGVSKDELPPLKKFQKEQGLNFPLLSDPDLTVHNAYGAYGEKSLYGKTVIGTLRSTFVLDEDGHDRAVALQREGDRPRRVAAQEARPRRLTGARAAPSSGGAACSAARPGRMPGRRRSRRRGSPHPRARSSAGTNAPRPPRTGRTP